MQVTETLSDGLKRGYTVVVPAADIEGRRAAKLAELGKTLRLPGFRPGKVPMPVVRQRYGTAVMAEVLQESVETATQQVLTDRGLRPALQPKVDVVNIDSATAPEATDLEFKVEMELLPEIAMPDFAGITLTRLKATPDAEVMDKALADIASRQSDLVDITEERAAQTGDVLTVDFSGSVDGVKFPGGTGSDMPVEIGGQGFIPGFSEQMEGMKTGETKVIDVTFPEEYGAKELAGKAAQFEITAKKMQQKVPAAVDDALATKLGLESADKLREAVSEQIQREYDQLSRLRIKRALLDALAERADFTAPESMVEGEFAQIWQRVEADIKAGTADEEDKGKDEDTLRAEYRGIAERRVKLGLLLSEIGRVNGVTVSAEEMTRAMRMEASRYPGQEGQVIEFFRKNPQAAESLRGPIFEDKVVDYVLELAKVEDKPVTAKELAEDDAKADDSKAGEAAA